MTDADVTPKTEIEKPRFKFVCRPLVDHVKVGKTTWKYDTKAYFVDRDGKEHEITTLAAISFKMAADDLVPDCTLLMLSPEIEIETEDYEIAKK